jgi:hypothetical protein
MRKQIISVFDTRICDNNLGNWVIMEPLTEFIRETFPTAFLIHLPDLEDLGDISLGHLATNEYASFGGACALSAKMETGRLWGLNEENDRHMKDVVLVGFGSKHYGEFSELSKRVYRHCLHHNTLNSVRDSYTENKMHDMGFNNVVNTGCTSLWRPDNQSLDRLPESKAEDVVVTLTCYHRPPLERRMLHTLSGLYKNLYFWHQRPEDIDYLQEFDVSATTMPPSLSYYNSFLKFVVSVNYVGTRLYGGIRSLQKEKQTLIIGMDCRVLEIDSDFQSPVLERNAWWNCRNGSRAFQ